MSVDITHFQIQFKACKNAPSMTPATKATIKFSKILSLDILFLLDETWKAGYIQATAILTWRPEAQIHLTTKAIHIQTN